MDGAFVFTYGAEKIQSQLLERSPRNLRELVNWCVESLNDWNDPQLVFLSSLK